MNTNDIIQSLELYKKNEFTCKFLENTIYYFKKLPNKIFKLTDNVNLLAGIRIHLLYNKYHIYLLDYLKKDKCTRELKLSQKSANNLINQIDGIKRNSMLLCNKLTTDKLHLYLTISKDVINGEEELIPDMWLPLIGLHSLYFLEHQNLDHYCSNNVVNNTLSILTNLDKFRYILKNIDLLNRDRYFILSGLIGQFYGAIYTTDIDIIFVGKNPKDVEKYSKVFPSFLDFNPTVPDEYDTGDSYREKFYKYILPQLGNAENIYEVLINPEQHFYFMGFKCLNLFTHLKREIGRSNPASYIDFIMLKNLNNIDKIQDYCVKNISIRKGKAEIINDKNDMNKYHNTIMYLLKRWYNLSIADSKEKSLKILRKNVVKCTKKYGTIYRPSNTNQKDPLIYKQIVLHRDILRNYIYNYGKNVYNLLDVGSGKLVDSKVYVKMNIREMYAIEPSKESLIVARQTVNDLKKKGCKINFKLFQGFGDQPFPFKKKFDIITFIFTIHYMIANLDKVLENIDTSSKSGTKLIITCINGNKLIPELKKNSKYEIRHKNDIMWGVYKYNDNLNIKLAKVLFFMKDVYGLENGSEEYLVDIDMLIKSFESVGFKLQIQKTFLEEYNQNHKNNNDLEPFQKKILDIHHILYFIKL